MSFLMIFVINFIIGGKFTEFNNYLNLYYCGTITLKITHSKKKSFQNYTTFKKNIHCFSILHND